MTRVMISYRNIPDQKEFAFKVASSLHEAGIDTWIDENDIPRLSNWEDEIFRGIIDSDYVLLCLSPEYFESETCLFECYVARGYGKKILPIIMPHENEFSIRELADQRESTRGIDNLQFISFNADNVIGLPESIEDRINRIIQAIENPTPATLDYDIYISYKVQYGALATHIADTLNITDFSTFVATRALDIGVDWRRICWDALISAEFHIIILSPDVADSTLIANEVLVSRTKDTVFVPILPVQFNNQESRSKIIKSFERNKNLAHLNDIHWFPASDNDEDFFADLVEAINEIRARNS